MSKAPSILATDSGEIEALQIGGGIDAHTDFGATFGLSQQWCVRFTRVADSGSISVKLATEWRIHHQSAYGLWTDIDPSMNQATSVGPVKWRGDSGWAVGGAVETDSGNIDNHMILYPTRDR